MKAAVVLSILSLFACGLANADSHLKHDKGLERLHKDDRAACTSVCVEGAGSDVNSSNWVVQINTNIYLVYNSNLNYFVIVNVSTGFAILLSGSNNIAVIININTGAYVYVNLATGAALYVSGTGAISGLLSVSTVYAASIIVYNTISTVAITGSLNLTTGFYFSVTSIVSFLSTNSDITILFQGRIDFATSFKADFGAYFVSVNGLFLAGAVSITDYFGVFFAPILGLTATVNATIASIYKFWVVVIVKLNGGITSALLDAFRFIIAVETLKIEIALALLTAAIKLVGIAYADISAALAAFKSNTVAAISTTIAAIGQDIYTINSAIQADKSWYFRIQKGLSLDIYFYYSAASNIFIIYNASIKYAVVFVGEIGFYAIVNVAKGATIAVSKGVAIYGSINAAAIISAFSSTTVDVNLIGGVAVLVSAAKSVYALISTSSSSTFKLAGALSAGASGSLATYFSSQGAVLANLQKDFAIVFSAQFSYSVSFKEFSIIKFVLFGIADAFVSGFTTFVQLLYAKLNGYFTVAFWFIVFAQLGLYLAAGFGGALFGLLIAGLRAILFPAFAFGAVAAIVSSLAIFVGVSITF